MGSVGGGFGVRGELYPEDVLVCLAALRLRRPVKWIEDRRENLIATNHSRQQIHHIRGAIDREGRILAIDNEFFHDQGGYVRTHAATVPDLTAAMLPWPYRVPTYRAVGHIRLTNKTPGGTYRAPGRYESTFVRERLIDAIAAKTGTAQLVDPSTGGYYDNRYLHSFFGYFPASNPRFLVFLYTYDPQGVELAAHTLTIPFFNITKFLINYYDISPDR